MQKQSLRVRIGFVLAVVGMAGAAWFFCGTSHQAVDVSIPTPKELQHD
jgi:hypothetical protein